MARHTAPVCHGRAMKLDAKSRQYVCRVCGGWTTRLLILALGGGR
ncbi:hypothetical protein OS965_37215 [Streptomyces sp. H27-G5]|nr:hypothetical protein [Streptomyces sp. H27-G5]MCY0923722.1 hypothetical protein [Streptomyces sp. H27-G5]